MSKEHKVIIDKGAVLRPVGILEVSVTRIRQTLAVQGYVGCTQNPNPGTYTCQVPSSYDNLGVPMNFVLGTD